MFEEDSALIQRMSAWLGRSQSPAEPHKVEVLGSFFLVLPGVFSPQFYPETKFFAEHLTKYLRRGVRFLDLGCGVGVNSVLAGRAGATGIALDINPKSVRNTRENLLRFGLAQYVDVRKSDIYSALKPGELFDLIYWNVPFTYRSDGTRLSILEEAIFDPGHRKITEFVAGARVYLAHGGQVFLGASPTLGNMDLVQELADLAGFTVETVAEGLEQGNDVPTALCLLRLARSGAIG